MKWLEIKTVTKMEQNESYRIPKQLGSKHVSGALPENIEFTSWFQHRLASTVVNLQLIDN